MTKFVNWKYDAKLEFLEVWGVQTKKRSVMGMDIFCNKTVRFYTITVCVVCMLCYMLHHKNVYINEDMKNFHSSLSLSQATLKLCLSVALSPFPNFLSRWQTASLGPCPLGKWEEKDLLHSVVQDNWTYFFEALYL